MMQCPDRASRCPKRGPVEGIGAMHTDCIIHVFCSYSAHQLAGLELALLICRISDLVDLKLCTGFGLELSQHARKRKRHAIVGACGTNSRPCNLPSLVT